MQRAQFPLLTRNSKSKCQYQQLRIKNLRNLQTWLPLLAKALYGNFWASVIDRYLGVHDMQHERNIHHYKLAELEWFHCFRTTRPIYLTVFTESSWRPKAIISSPTLWPAQLMKMKLILSGCLVIWWASFLQSVMILNMGNLEVLLLSTIYQSQDLKTSTSRSGESEWVTES